MRLYCCTCTHNRRLSYREGNEDRLRQLAVATAGHSYCCCPKGKSIARFPPSVVCFIAPETANPDGIKADTVPKLAWCQHHSREDTT